MLSFYREKKKGGMVEEKHTKMRERESKETASVSQRQLCYSLVLSLSATSFQGVLREKDLPWDGV